MFGGIPSCRDLFIWRNSFVSHTPGWFSFALVSCLTPCPAQPRAKSADRASASPRPPPFSPEINPRSDVLAQRVRTPSVHIDAVAPAFFPGAPRPAPDDLSRTFAVTDFLSGPAGSPVPQLSARGSIVPPPPLSPTLVAAASAALATDPSPTSTIIALLQQRVPGSPAAAQHAMALLQSLRSTVGVAEPPPTPRGSSSSAGAAAASAAVATAAVSGGQADGRRSQLSASYSSHAGVGVSPRDSMDFGAEPADMPATPRDAPTPRQPPVALYTSLLEQLQSMGSSPGPSPHRAATSPAPLTRTTAAGGVHAADGFGARVRATSPGRLSLGEWKNMLRSLRS